MQPAPFDLAPGATLSAAAGDSASDLIECRAELPRRVSAESGTGSVNLDATTRKVTVVVQWNDASGSGAIRAPSSHRRDPPVNDVVTDSVPC